MSNVSSFIAGELLKDVTVPLLCLMPIFGVIWLLQRRKVSYELNFSEPFTNLPLRPPGESLRLKIEKLSSEFDEALLVMCLGSAVASGVLVGNLKLWPMILLLIIPIYFWSGRKTIRMIEQIWPLRLGFKGERAVGEELNQLLRQGFQVFHDLPFDSFNIDHVVVGPAGVYAIETKTRRKPKDISGKAKATVVYDGTALHFPKFSDQAAVEQAKRNASTLGKWLRESTGEPVSVSAILTLPGWWVDRRARGEVNVLNPSEIKRSFPARPDNPLTSAQIQRITHQLTERCKMRPEGSEKK